MVITNERDYSHDCLLIYDQELELIYKSKVTSVFVDHKVKFLHHFDYKANKVLHTTGISRV